jgi:hypothetical protein
VRVELYLVDAMEIASFVPIWRALRARGVDARIVAVPGEAHAGDARWFDHANATRLLRRAGVPFVEEPDPESDLAVTTQRPRILRHYRRLKARTMYAVGFYEMDGFQEDRIRGFDAIFAVGEHARRALSRHLEPGRIFVTGYPKYDGFFRAPPDRQAIRARLGLHPTEVVVAYVPTWREKSSIESYADAVADVARPPDSRSSTSPPLGRRILVKPHHCTVRFEPSRMALLAGLPRSILVSSDEPLVDVVAASDLVVVDARSGVLAEVLLTRPALPVILLSPPDERAPDGLDARLGELGPLVRRPADLGPAARALLASGELAGTNLTARRVAMADLFSHRDGSAADRTAAAMVALVKTHRPD